MRPTFFGGDFANFCTSLNYTVPFSTFFAEPSFSPEGNALSYSLLEMSVEVQATSIDAIVSKESSSARGYFHDPFLKFFVRDQDRKRRSPLINRGYYARHRVFELILQRFTRVFPGKRQIVSLGGGSETIWFRLKAAGVEPEMYVELDLPPITSQKAKTVRSFPELSSLVGPFVSPGEEDPSEVFISEKYRILSCDLTDTLEFEKLMRKHLDSTLPTLVLSECVLVGIVCVLFWFVFHNTPPF